MGKYHISQKITEFTPKILKMGEIYTDSEMCWLGALACVCCVVCVLCNVCVCVCCVMCVCVV